MIETIKKWFWYVVGIGILLLLATTCTDSLANRYFGESNVLDKQLHRKMELLNQAKVKSERVADSLRVANKKLDSTITLLRSKKISIDKEITAETKKDGVLVAKVRKYTYKQSAEYISKTYNDSKAVTYTDKGVTLGDSIPNKVVETIVDRDFLKKKLTLTEVKLDFTDKEVSLLEDKVKNKDLEIKTISDLSSKKDDALEASKDLNDATKKENKTLRRGRWINRALIVVAFIGGVLIAK